MAINIHRTLVDRDDIRQALAPRGVDQSGRDPRLAQAVGAVKLYALQAEFDRTPRERRNQLGALFSTFCLGKDGHLIIK